MMAGQGHQVIDFLKWDLVLELFLIEIGEGGEESLVHYYIECFINYIMEKYNKGWVNEGTAWRISRPGSIKWKHMTYRDRKRFHSTRGEEKIRIIINRLKFKTNIKRLNF